MLYVTSSPLFILIINSINHDIKTLLNAIVADMHNNSPSTGVSCGNPGNVAGGDRTGSRRTHPHSGDGET